MEVQAGTAEVRHRRQEKVGIVTSNKMQKTVVVTVTRQTTHRLPRVVDEHRGVFIEAVVSAVAPAVLLSHPHNHALDDFALGNLAVGRRFFHRRRHHVTQAVL